MKPLTSKIIPRTLHFKRPAGTSRGVLLQRKVWYLLFRSPLLPGKFGVGECAPLPGLSPELMDTFEQELLLAVQKLEAIDNLRQIRLQEITHHSSLLFAFETGLMQLQRQGAWQENSLFGNGKTGITINGLIWMGSYPFMLRQLEEKLAAGFRCIKIKIGNIDFDQELTLLKRIRREFAYQDIELRVDANGAFSPNEALEKLKRLSEWNIHSIEQPIAAGQWDRMAYLVHESPIPIALDEELIGIHTKEEKQILLQTIRPHYIILKPSLHGGIGGCAEWIRLMQLLNKGKKEERWWVTSALESNIGLNAIAQWTAQMRPTLPQGLGTGMLFTDNIDMPLQIRQDSLWFDPSGAFPTIETFIR